MCTCVSVSVSVSVCVCVCALQVRMGVGAGLVGQVAQTCQVSRLGTGSSRGGARMAVPVLNARGDTAVAVVLWIRHTDVDTGPLAGAFTDADEETAAVVGAHVELALARVDKAATMKASVHELEQAASIARDHAAAANVALRLVQATSQAQHEAPPLRPAAIAAVLGDVLDGVDVLDGGRTRLLLVEPRSGLVRDLSGANAVSGGGSAELPREDGCVAKALRRARASPGWRDVTTEKGVGAFEMCVPVRGLDGDDVVALLHAKSNREPLTLRHEKLLQVCVCVCVCVCVRARARACGHVSKPTCCVRSLYSCWQATWNLQWVLPKLQSKWRSSVPLFK